MSQEFRSIHRAKECLELFQKTRDLSIIGSSVIKKYDIWRSIFLRAGEIEAYREIETRQIYDSFSESCYDKILPLDLAIHYMTATHEDENGLTINEIAAIFLDVFGDDKIDNLIENADGAVERRRKIVSKYSEPDMEWVDEAISVQNALRNYR